MRVGVVERRRANLGLDAEFPAHHLEGRQWAVGVGGGDVEDVKGAGIALQGGAEAARGVDRADEGARAGN